MTNIDIINENNLELLFGNLWTWFPKREERRENCRRYFPKINEIFNSHKAPEEHNELIEKLSSPDFEDISVTIASGLIWTVYPNDRVPFDKWTMLKSIKLKIIRDDVSPNFSIDDIDEIVKNDFIFNYVNYSEKIKDYCDINGITIKTFVREAYQKTDYTEEETLF